MTSHFQIAKLAILFLLTSSFAQAQVTDLPNPWGDILDVSTPVPTSPQTSNQNNNSATKKVPQPSAAATIKHTTLPSGLIPLEQALNLKAPISDFNKIEKNKVFFSLKKDLFFQPSVMTIPLDNDCFAERQGTSNKIRVPADRLFKISYTIFYTDYKSIVFEANKNELLTIYCFKSKTNKTSDFISRIKPNVNLFYEMPTFKDAEMLKPVRVGEKVSMAKAVSENILPEYGYDILKDLAAYISFKKDILFFPNQQEVALDNGCQLIRHISDPKNEDSKKQFATVGTRLQANVKHRIIGATEIILNKARRQIYFSQKNMTFLYSISCGLRNLALPQLEENIATAAKFLVTVPNKDEFETWP